jgi:hypothetical protein
MRKSYCVAMGVLMVGCLLSVLQFGRAQEKAGSGGTVRVKVHYTGAGAVDEKHKILVFLFDTPDFVRGGQVPFAKMDATKKSATVAFSDVSKSPAYVTAVYDPKGAYDGGPPPVGASLGMYSKTSGEPGPVKVEAGKTVSVEVNFDDTVKMQ